MVTDPRPYVFSVPGLPPSLNEFQRWNLMKRVRLKHEWQAMIWPLLCEKGNVCPRPLNTPVELRAVLIFTTNRRRDSDNFGAVLWKWTQDVLEMRGYVPNDSHDLVKSYPPGFALGRRECTVITITSCMRGAA